MDGQVIQQIDRTFWQMSGNKRQGLPNQDAQKKYEATKSEVTPRRRLYIKNQRLKTSKKSALGMMEIKVSQRITRNRLLDRESSKNIQSKCILRD